PVLTKAKTRNPTWKIRKGDEIGTRVTLRKSAAENVLRNALEAVDFKLKENSFDKFGNVSFGVKEYIDYPGIKYDPKIGMYGFDVCVTLRRRGKRVSERMRKKATLGKAHLIKKEEAIEFAKQRLGAKIEE
ncbi:MAG: 50S ribosomal protein L5, partial [Candidatus Paceibacteria bacterium]